MSVTTTNIFDKYVAGGGEAGSENEIFPITFDFNRNESEDDEEQLQVLVVDPTQVREFTRVNSDLNQGDSFVLLDNDSNPISIGTDVKAEKVRLTVPLGASETLYIFRTTALKQTHEYKDGDKYYATNNENVADNAVQIVQEQQHVLDRTISFDKTFDPSGLDLTLPEPEADKVLGWNSTADAIENKEDIYNVNVTANDSTPGYLNDKIVAGTGINTSVLNSGLDEDLEITADETTIDHDGLLNYEANEHIDHTAVNVLPGVGLKLDASTPSTLIDSDTALAVDPSQPSTSMQAVSGDVNLQLTNDDILIIYDANDDTSGEQTKKVDLQQLGDYLNVGGGSGETNLGLNLSPGTHQVFRDKTGVTLNFRTLTAGPNITMDQTTDPGTISISASSGSGQAIEIINETTGTPVSLTLDVGHLIFRGGLGVYKDNGLGAGPYPDADQIIIEGPEDQAWPAPLYFKYGGNLTFASTFLDSAAPVATYRVPTRIRFHAVNSGIVSESATFDINIASTQNPGVTKGTVSITVPYTNGPVAFDYTLLPAERLALTMQAGDFMWIDASAVGGTGIQDGGFAVFFGSQAIVQQDNGSQIPAPAHFFVDGPLTFPVTDRIGSGYNVNGPREITGFRLHAFDSGTSGQTTVRIHKSALGPTGAASFDIVLPANGGENAANGPVSMSLEAGDILYASIPEVPGGPFGVEDLSIDLFFGTEGLMSSLTLAGKLITDINDTNYKMLMAAQIAGAYASFVNPDGTAYEIVDGKKFRIDGIRVIEASTSTSVNNMVLGYSTAPAINEWNQATAPTGWAKLFGDHNAAEPLITRGINTANYDGGGTTFKGSTDKGFIEQSFAGLYITTSGVSLYPGIEIVGGTTGDFYVQMFGKEENV